MIIKIKINPLNIAEAIENELANISEVSGIGADGESEYSVDNVSVSEVEGEYVAEFEVTFVSGKFAGKDDIGEEIESQIDGLSIDVDLEVA